MHVAYGRRPFRVAEFDDLLAGRHRPMKTRLVLDLERRPEVAARAVDLAVRETGCCSFFTFELTATSGGLTLAISVPGSRTEVLDALAAEVSGMRTGEVAEAAGVNRETLRYYERVGLLAPRLRERAGVKLGEVEERIADLEVVRDTLRAAISAGCDDLVTCSHSPSCPLPFAGLG